MCGRLAGLLLGAVIVVLPVAGRAAPPSMLGVGEAGPAPIQEVAVRCGPGRHWVRAHRTRHGKVIPARCVHDHRRR